MNKGTYKAIEALLAADDSIKPAVRGAVLAVLTNGPPEDDGPKPVLLSQTQAAKLLGVSRSTLFRMVRDGEIEPVQVRGLRRYRYEDLQKVGQAEKTTP